MYNVHSLSFRILSLAPDAASGLQLCFMNAQSAVNKTLDISDFIYDKNIDIMVAAETWFRSDPRLLATSHLRDITSYIALEVLSVAVA